MRMNDDEEDEEAARTARGQHTEECELERSGTTCSYFMLAPFKTEVWSDIFFFLILSIPVTACQFAWTLTTLLVSLPLCLLLPPVGFGALCLSANTWRHLARLDLLLLSAVGAAWQKPAPLPALSGHPVLERGFLRYIWQWTVVLLGSPTTWACVIYFTLLKPLLVLACVGFLAGGLFLSLILIANLFLTLLSDSSDSSSSSSEDWGGLSGFEWIFNTPLGSLVTIPFALLIFWGISMALLPLGRLYKRTVISVLTQCEQVYRRF